MKRVADELRTLRRLLYQALFRRGTFRPEVQEEIVDGFHKLYYDSSVFEGTWRNTFWHGVRIVKCPLDLWVYQELLFDLRPDLIIECGTAHGGSALFLANMCDLLGHGEVVTIDIEERDGRPTHERIEYVRGSTTDPHVVAHVKERIKSGGEKSVMVLLDSDHSRDHVFDELRIYSDFVTPGSYLIVEDTNVNGHPVEPDFGPGPMEALDDFLKLDRRFTIDHSREKFYLTFNPRGFLRRSDSDANAPHGV
jgi:cephalosporin hydroxylase